MRFRILGPMRVYAAGDSDAGVRARVSHTPRAAKLRVVLGALLVRDNEVVSVGSLTDELWEDSPPRTATTTIQVYVSQLRKLLHAADPGHGRDALVTRRPGYLLRTAPTELDSTVFEELHRQGRTAADAGDFAAASRLQRRALELWRGPLLSDAPHGPLLRSAAVRLGEARMAALDQRVRADLALGEDRSLIAELRSVTSEHPLLEGFHAHLMVALYRTGRQAEALQAYARVRRTLVDELGIEPGLELQRLQRRILDGDPALLHPAAAGRERVEITAMPGPVITRPPGHAPRPATAPAPSRSVPPPSASSTSSARGPATAQATTTSLESLTSPGNTILPGAATAAPRHVATPVSTATTTYASAPRHASALITDTLPAADACFAGRDAEMALVEGLLRDASAGAWVGVTGRPGVGKTALAVEAAHRVADAFPDGRIFLDLRPESGRPLEPAEALARLVRRAGGPAVPKSAGRSAEDLRDELRSLLAGRRVLLVLDNAHSKAQLGPLLPTAEGTTALVTGRRLPAGLPGVRPVVLDDVTAAEARAMLPSADDPRAVSEIAELCGRLPLALRIADAQLAARPRWTASSLAARLRAEPARLDVLSFGGLDVRERLMSAYRDAPEAGRRAFRLLVLLPPGPFTERTAAAVLNVSAARAAGLVEELADARLIESGPDGYDFHPLLRLLAAERLAREESPREARAAVERMCHAYAVAAETPRAVPGEWFARQRAVLVRAVRQAHERGLWSLTVRIADALTTHVETQAAWDDWEATHSLALDAAMRGGDRAARARMLRSLGDLAWQQRRVDQAGTFYERARRAAKEAQEPEEYGRALVGLAELRLDAGAPGDAAALLESALDVVAAPGYARGRYETHRALALLALRSADRVAAEGHFAVCLDLATQLADRRLEAYARRSLAALHAASAVEIRPGVWRLGPSAGAGSS